VSGITGAVGGLGLGGKKEEEPKVDDKKPEDPRVDRADDKQVEDFLKSQYPSKTT
jgi:hypothetical protein